MFSGANSILSRSSFRFTMLLCGLFVIVLLASGVIINATLRSQVQSDIDENLAFSYQEFANDGISPSDIVNWFDELSDEDGFFYFAFRTADGRIFGDVSADAFETMGYQTLPAAVLFDPNSISDFRDLFDESQEGDDDKWRVYTGPVGNGTIVLFEPIEGVEDALGIVPWILASAGAALVFTTLIAGAALAFRQQQRIDQIEKGLQRIGRGELDSPIAPSVVRDDLDRIMVGIDDTADQLNTSMSQLRLFTQNAAHELNTPLARLRAELEQLKQSPEKDAALDQADTVIRTLSGVQRIARLSHRPNTTTFGTINLNEICELMDELYSDVISESSQSLVMEISDTTPVQGDFQLIAQLTSNLIENAIRHAGSDAQITVQCEGCSIRIHDTGAGIPAHKRHDIFAPFERDDGAGGSGLGLALVQAIANYHGAGISLTDNNGFAIKVTFPAQQEI